MMKTRLILGIAAAGLLAAAAGPVAAQSLALPACTATANATHLAIRQVDAADTPDRAQLSEPVVVNGQTVWLRRQPLTEGDFIDAAFQTVDVAGRPRVFVSLSAKGAMCRSVLGGMNAGMRVALIAEGKVIALPVIDGASGYESFMVRLDGFATTEQAIATAAALSPVPMLPRSAYANYKSSDPAIAAAAAAGDVKRIMQLNGTPLDVIAAERAILARDPNAPVNPQSDVPLYRWLESMDRELAQGRPPVFIQDQGRTHMAQLYADGRVRSSTAVPGMNGPDVPLMGQLAHITTPAEILGEDPAVWMARMRAQLDESKARLEAARAQFEAANTRSNP